MKNDDGRMDNGRMDDDEKTRNTHDIHLFYK